MNNRKVGVWIGFLLLAAAMVGLMWQPIHEESATADSEAFRRFFREARSAATLSHPNICPIYDIGEFSGTPYLTMAYIEGKPLSALVEPGKPMDQRRAMEIVRMLARAMEQAQGFAKLIAAQDDDEILGVHVVGPMAGELIAEAVLAMEYSASSEDLQRTIHAHPTLSEAIHEAALAVDKRAIDSINK